MGPVDRRNRFAGGIRGRDPDFFSGFNSPGPVFPPHPKKGEMGILLLVLVGGALYGIAREVMVFVWMGLRYILGLEYEGL